MPKLFRLETEDNVGIYQCIHYRNIHSTWDVMKKHPGPGRDPKLWDQIKNIFPLGFRFGFSSARQMHKWFTKKDFKAIKEVATGRDYSLYVSVYDGPVIEGDKQAIANLHECRLLKRIPIEKFCAPKKKMKRAA